MGTPQRHAWVTATLAAYVTKLRKVIQKLGGQSVSYASAMPSHVWANANTTDSASAVRKRLDRRCDAAAGPTINANTKRMPTTCVASATANANDKQEQQRHQAQRHTARVGEFGGRSWRTGADAKSRRAPRVTRRRGQADSTHPAY